MNSKNGFCWRRTGPGPSSGFFHLYQKQCQLLCLNAFDDSSHQEHLILMGFPAYEQFGVGNLRFPLVSLDGLSEASLKTLAGNESRSVQFRFEFCCFMSRILIQSCFRHVGSTCSSIKILTD